MKKPWIYFPRFFDLIDMDREVLYHKSCVNNSKKGDSNHE